ncbi:MAG TPA: NADH-ubiquinone oxidoreductase-F iron-sulfur binding region domain-containing protein [Acidimicrobiia bacterium]|nr:NADH-ubiquinone oxidoreductase-F iron-sulfur binding region domain-containing protein [Acidimicrobiia bacterium]
MPPVTRVLAPEPVRTLADYLGAGGGRGLDVARRVDPDAIIDEVETSGLQGRGGAGFPAGRKWRTVAAMDSPSIPSTVVVNGAEGEPGSFKDRAILRANPYHVLEGAIIAARAVRADRIIVGVKRAFTHEVARLRRAIDEADHEGWTDGLKVWVFEGPSEYLYGEETALLECIDGRYPFPRIAPPWRRGVEEVVASDADVTTGSASAAHVEMTAPQGESEAPPTLASNVETFANVPAIIAEGADWFRSVGTDGSPGTIVCTITGRARRHGVAEFAMGTPMSEAIEVIGGGPEAGHHLLGALSGVSNPMLPAALFDTPMSHEAMRAQGTGLGTGGFILYDERDDPAAIAAGVSRFLAVESCGQCTPCKLDGLALAERLAHVAQSEPDEPAERDPVVEDLDAIDGLIRTVTDSARCNLAYQQHDVVDSILGLFEDRFRDHLLGALPPAEPETIAPIVDIVDGRAVLDERQRAKQPDWTYDTEYSGKTPADRLDDHRAHEQL